MIIIVIAAVAAVIDAVIAVVRERQMHEEAGLRHLDFFAARRVLRRAFTGAIPEDPAAQLETVRVVETHQRYAVRTMRWMVPLFGVVAAAGFAGVVIGSDWSSIAVPACACMSGAALAWDWREGKRRLKLLRMSLG